jgi:hypothetical protein
MCFFVPEKGHPYPGLSLAKFGLIDEKHSKLRRKK